MGDMAISRLRGQSAVDLHQAESTQAAHAPAAPAAPHKAKGQGFLPGEAAPKSGQYALEDSRGNRVGKETTMKAGSSFPPARPGLSYKLVDGTKHSSQTGS